MFFCFFKGFWVWYTMKIYTFQKFKWASDIFSDFMLRWIRIKSTPQKNTPIFLLGEGDPIEIFKSIYPIDLKFFGG